MYENHRTAPLPLRPFVLRVLLHFVLAQCLMLLSLLAGMLGYRHYEQMDWSDAFVNTAMLLGGMGPVKTEGLSEAGKLFAGIYALYAGVVFIAVMSIMLAPLVHRAMHLFHWRDHG